MSTTGGITTATLTNTWLSVGSQTPPTVSEFFVFDAANASLRYGPPSVSSSTRWPDGGTTKWASLLIPTTSAGVTTVLVLYDEDGDQDFAGHTKVKVSYSDGSTTAQPWNCGPVTLIPDVNPVIALFDVTPPVQLPGCLWTALFGVLWKGLDHDWKREPHGQSSELQGGITGERSSADIPFTLSNVTVYAPLTTRPHSSPAKRSPGAGWASPTPRVTPAPR